MCCTQNECVVKETLVAVFVGLFAGVACVVAAFFIVHRLAVGVEEFAVGGIVDALGNCGTPTCVAFGLSNHPHHPSLRCVEFLLYLFLHRPRA